MLGELRWADRAARFEQSDFQPGLRQLLGGPAARGARTYNHGIVRLLQRILLDGIPGHL